MHNTSRVADEPYPNLLREMGFGGFPSLAFLDAEGEKRAVPNARDVAVFESTLHALGVVDALSAKAERSAEEDAELFAARLDLGAIPFAEARPLAEKHLKSLPAARAVEVENELRLLEMADVLRRAGKERTKAFADFAAMAKADRAPTGPRSSTFWIGVMSFALEQKDAELLERGIHAMETEFATRPGLDAMLARFRDGLAELKKKD